MQTMAITLGTCFNTEWRWVFLSHPSSWSITGMSSRPNAKFFPCLAPLAKLTFFPRPEHVPNCLLFIAIDPTAFVLHPLICLLFSLFKILQKWTLFNCKH